MYGQIITEVSKSNNIVGNMLYFLISFFLLKPAEFAMARIFRIINLNKITAKTGGNTGSAGNQVLHNRIVALYLFPVAYFMLINLCLLKMPNQQKLQKWRLHHEKGHGAPGRNCRLIPQRPGFGHLQLFYCCMEYGRILNLPRPRVANGPRYCHCRLWPHMCESRNKGRFYLKTHFHFTLMLHVGHISQR